MRREQMWPKQTLDAEDLHALDPNGVVITIESVDFKTFESNQIGEAEVKYYLRCLEFKKPIPLNKTNGETVFDVTRTEDTDEWPGKVIRLVPVQISITDRTTKKKKRIWTFDIDTMAPTSKATLPPKQDITGLAAGNRFGRPAIGAGSARPILGTSGVVGIDRAVDIAAALHERGSSVDALAKHIDRIGMGEQVAGKPLPEWSEALLPVARKFCQGFPKTHAAATPAQREQFRAAWAPPAPEVVNRNTGEVLTGQGQQYEAIADDDIPF